MDGVSDELILKLAEEIGNAWNLRKLALKLGFSLSDADIFVKTNQLNGRVTSEGTLEMLRQWRNNTPADQPSTNGDQREEHTRKRFRSELSDTIVEKDDIPTIQVVVGFVLRELESQYTDSRRFQEVTPLHEQGFLPLLKRRNGYQSSSSALENSRHDIFTAQLARKQLRRIVVSHNSPVESTALCHSLAYDWATQNRSSRLSEMQFLFELSCSEIKPNQTIEAAIKDQLFSKCDQIDETLIKELIEKMPDGVTILLDGYNGNNVMEDILTGRTLKEVTVMVTAKPRSANLLHRMASGVYDHIDMY
ncbi:uncharacterized protein LOC121417656 [Lytechinus variegatus]|uniref:uncharacterized protein LOC121417656 n=1 Tax=Lytechinus variegatus TaxID=7654 RepID=UPI001BB28F78|nr:uncharacterized protein LOC121417656 [Lytechinus variegatus]